MKRVHFLKHRCKGCGLCVLFCPQKILRMSEDINDQGHAFPEDTDPQRCTACGLCFRMCPDCAIEIREADETVAARQDQKTDE